MKRRFTRIEWSYTTNIYEVNIRQYTTEGTFEAFSHHIPRLAEMGVEVLWLMPVTPISREGRLGILGSYYACSDYTAANPEFGTVGDLKNLVEQAHAAGMKVIIDWVANHTGHDHHWTKTHPEFYRVNDEGKFYDKHGWEDVIDLNYYDHSLRREMVKAMQFWIDNCGIDGFRCDMAHLVPLDFWRDARLELEKTNPLFWLAETGDPIYLDVFDCIYGWDWMHKTEAFAKQQAGLQTLKYYLQGLLENFPRDGSHLFFTTNHDENSWNGTEFEKYGAYAPHLAIFSATWNGIPLLYSGQEMPNTKRLKFFEKDTIPWDGEYRLAEFYKTLFGLRKKNPALQAGYERTTTRFLTDDHAQVLAFERVAGKDAVLVLLNFSNQEQHFSISPTLFGSYQNVFSNETRNIVADKELQLAPNEHLVLERVGEDFFV